MLPSRSAEVSVRDGETTTVVLGAPPSSPVRVSGRVHRGNQAVPGVQVSVWKSRSEVSATTGADGRYELVVDGAGSCTFGLYSESGGTQTSRHVEIPDAASFTLDFELASGRIAGRVLGADGEPVHNAWVQLAVDPSRAELSSTGVHGWTQTPPNGSFAFESLGPGIYQLTVTDMRGQFTGGGSAQHGSVVRGGLRLEEGGSIEGLVIRLEEAASLEGTVTTASGGPAIGARIAVRDEQGEIQQNWWNTTTDGAGRYRVGGLAPGSWSVSARLGSDVSEESASVLLSAGAAATVDLALRHGTMLEVVVEDSAGNVVGAAISVRDERGREHARMPFMGHDGGDASSARTIGPLVPGTYEVSATNHDEVRASERVSLHGEAARSVRLRMGGS
jgi:protocatechuate 3,4-dioxygenase beta subunit